MFKRILIANRGEIAVRIIRACRELGIESIAVYSDADRAALHVREADHAYPVGPAPAAESYLNTAKILEAAKRLKADAVDDSDIYAVCDGVSALNRSPRVVLRFAELSFLGRMPPDRGRIEDQGRALQGGEARAFRIPLVPADERADFSGTGIE